MKQRLKIFGLLLFTALLPIQGAESFRKDINPALLYWQAFGEWPTLADADHDYLYTNNWQGGTMPADAGKHLAKFDNAFKLLRRAAKSQVKCDWGYDLSDGPETLLPGLAKAKLAAQTARLRALWHLQNGDQTSAREDLAAAYTLGRNVSTDGILISALVQFAVEGVVTAAVVENFYQFKTETLKQLQADIDAAPARGTIAQCILAERVSFASWLLRKIDQFKAQGMNDQQVVEAMRQTMQRSFSGEENRDPDIADRIIKASGANTQGLVAHINEVFPLYDEADELMALPYTQFMPRIKVFNEKIHAHKNLLVGVFFPVFEKCRGKEFAAEVNSAMLRAGIEYRVAGAEALKRVQDPVFKEPFGFARHLVDGTDRGFILSSQLATRDFPERVLFIEKPGPALSVIGKNTGSKIK